MAFAIARLTSADRDVERGRDEGRRGHVEDAQEIEAGEQAAEDGAAGVGAVEHAHPGDALGGGLDPARGGGQRCAHQEGRRDEAEARDERAQQDRRQAVPDGGGIDAVDQRHAEEHQHAAERDAELDLRVDAQRVLRLAPTSGAAARDCRRRVRP